MGLSPSQVEKIPVLLLKYLKIHAKQSSKFGVFKLFCLEKNFETKMKGRTFVKGLIISLNALDGRRIL